MFCPKCGTKWVTSAEFCFSCGKPIKGILGQIALEVNKPLDPLSGRPRFRLRRKPALLGGSLFALLLILAIAMSWPLFFAKRLSQAEAESLLIGNSLLPMGLVLERDYNYSVYEWGPQVFWSNSNLCPETQIGKIINNEGFVLAGGSYTEADADGYGSKRIVENIIEFPSASEPRELLDLATRGYADEDCTYREEDADLIGGFWSENLNFNSDPVSLGLRKSQNVIYFEKTYFGEYLWSEAMILIADGPYLVQIKVTDYNNESATAKQIALRVLGKIYRDRTSLS